MLKETTKLWNNAMKFLLTTPHESHKGFSFSLTVSLFLLG